MAVTPVELPTEPVTKHVPPQRAMPDRTASTTGPGSSKRPPRSGRNGWWVWLFLIALGAAGWHYQAVWWPVAATVLERLSPPKPTKPPQRVVTVGTAPVGQRDVEIYLNGLGTVTAFKTVTVRSRVEGELIEVAIAEGQAVEEGDLLAKIDPRVWQAQLEQAEGQLARDEATLKAARLTLTRYQQLLKENIVSAQQIDEQVSLSQQSEAAVKTDQAMIANAKLQLEYCQIHAPIGGRIGLRLVDAGNIVRANDPGGLAVITQLQPISLVFTIPQDDISRVLAKSRGPEPLAVDAFDRDFRNKLATGTLTAIDNQVDSATGTLRLKAVFDNDDESLFPNQFVNARLLVETLPDAIVAPTAAVQRGPDSTFVYVLQADETVALREITTGPNAGTDTVIESGLEPGEVVITEGLDKLKPGDKVATKEQAEKKAKGGKGGPRPDTDGDKRREQMPPAAAKAPQ
ncbi:MAG TPA: MdtA/MuxA family multidrug efflux RND transporter periplasmic adaptor subunit [Planctomycetaceae bacterium]|nr:MdtA/MuxA family multidrug efflux RND transporter periplasmic adaptor subunit [Planctomycetaceae bacterium]